MRLILSRYVWYASLVACGICGLSPLPSARAQQTSKIDMNTVDQHEVYDDHQRIPTDAGSQRQADSLRQHQLHLVHVSPHRVMFDTHTKAATLTFSNPTNVVAEGEVELLFAYTDWPHSRSADTAVLAEDWQSLAARDTIVFTPGPKDPFLGPWLSGLPTEVRLAPHQTRQVTIQLAPPPHLPNGTYWARVLVIARPLLPHRGKGDKDTHRRYALPVKGEIPDTLRDSVLVFYHQGAQRRKLLFGPGGGVAFDSLNYGGPNDGGCQDRMWIRLPVRLAGNTPIDGKLFIMFRNVETNALVLRNIYPFALFRPGTTVTHWWAQLCCGIPPGTYRAVLQFVSDPQHDIPPAQRLPVDTVTYTIPTPVKIMGE